MNSDETEIPANREAEQNRNADYDPPARWYRNAAWALLAIHTGLLGWIAVWNAPVCDEVAHLTAGLYEWRYGQFFLYRVNPPLVKLVAALPAALGNPVTDWSRVADGSAIRMEFAVGRDFIHANAPNGYRYHTMGRLLCLPFTVLGGWMCFLWGRSLYGPRSGFISCLLWCVNPVVLGWGSTFTPDAASASFGLLAAYAFRNWLYRGTWTSSFWAGLTLGLCELTKMTWIVLFPLWPTLWLYWKWKSRNQQQLQPKISQLFFLLCFSVYVLNVGYGFEGTGRELGKYDFVSQTLTGDEVTGRLGNRFRDTILARVPVPLPYNYVRGIDLQKVDFEKGMESYLFGTWSDRGWWYYYPVAASLKLPLGMLLLFVLAIGVHIIWSERFRISRDEIVLFLPAIIVFLLVCSQTGFGRYIRYLLPSLPAVLIFISKLWRGVCWLRCRWLLHGLLLWSIVSPLRYYPYEISYFNELAGGPENGYRYLLDANVDWGQDLLRMKYWIGHHPEARPLYCIHTGYVSPADIGVDNRWPPKMSDSPEDTDFVPEPGWYVVSIHELYQEHGFYHYLHKYKPVGRIGYSMLIFHIE